MAMGTINELFEHELGDAFAAEQKVLEGLTEMIGESKDREIKKALQEHKKETQEQIKRLRQVFRMLKSQPGGDSCPGMEGLIKEKKMFTKQKPTSDLLQYFNLGAAQKVERYEITAYEDLIEMAEQLHLSEAVNLLQQTLQEEQRMLERVKAFSKNFDTSGLLEGGEGEEAEGFEEDVA